MSENYSPKQQLIKEMIKTEAYHLGFSHVGFTHPTKPPHFDQFLEWLDGGNAADMQYLSRPDTIAKRENPLLIQQNCKSIIVFALPYTPANLIQNRVPKVASYAIGVDYHQIIPKLLESIIEKIKNLLTSKAIEYRIYTDTGPILEKDFAQKAGIGWIGKNSCLISPTQGSYFFLSEILINVEFEPDEPFRSDHCGSCTRCIDACPTNCILPNRTIDANNCISYLTIENRKLINHHQSEHIGIWLFGCDICQEICPWNIRFSQIPKINYFEFQNKLDTFNLINEFSLNKHQFKEKYKLSPILRAKYEGFMRNILIVMNNNFQEDFLKPIIEFIQQKDNDELVDLAKWVLNNNNK